VQLDLFRSLWGVLGPDERFTSLAEALPPIVDGGYAGVAAPLFVAESIPDFRSQLGERGLDYIALVMTEGDTVAEHVASFEQALENAQFHRPRFVVSHSGRDAFSETEAGQFFERAMQIEQDAAFAVAHETHRGRILYNPWVTDRMLGRFPDLRLCVDFSHWVCVCERLLDTELDVVRRCAERALHVDARVGFEQGPQVPDPRAPEWADHLAAHERWWSMVWEAQEARGERATTLTPEWGPPPYLPTLPYSQQPVADIWEIAGWMGERQRVRFDER
jgi:hypothetical protein